MFYENMMSFSVAPGKAVGEPVDITPYYPSCSWMNFRYEGTTGAAGTGDQLYLYTSGFAPVAEIRGTYGLDKGRKRLDCSNRFPEYTCAVYFKNYLSQKGITCTGGAADFKLKREWYGDRKPGEGIGTDGDSLKVIGRFRSPTLARIAFKTNHESNNLLAETLFRTLGKEATGNSCSDSSYVAMEKILKQMHVGSSGLNIQDGSGLSRQNLVSADFICRFLGAMMDSACFEEYIWGLPSPGGNGTLSYNMKGQPEPLRSRFHVKSGSMNGVRCYSGYILPEGYAIVPGEDIPQEIKDRTIIFSVMTNNCTSPSWKVRSMLDRFMVGLAGF
jgi:D-alanyl-D-alanine carboxypeptidase/D-alanyl-D-alanine-endopeptidase (penicillin-binding protein 4)